MLRELEPIDGSHDAQDAGIPYSSLKFLPNAVDLKIEDRNPAQLYEENCFNMIASEIDGGLLIGPHLIDRVFEGGHFAETHRPDAIQLAKDENNGMRIARMWEFKSGKVKGDIPQKIRGLKRMLDKLRDDPTYLGQNLRDAIGDHYPLLPRVITIPPVEEVGLTFITTMHKNTTEPATFGQLELRIRPKAQRVIEVPLFNSSSLYEQSATAA